VSVVVKNFVLVGVEADFIVLLLLVPFSGLKKHYILLVLRVNLGCWGVSVFVVPVVDELPGLRVCNQPLSDHRDARIELKQEVNSCLHPREEPRIFRHNFLQEIAHPLVYMADKILVTVVSSLEH